MLNAIQRATLDLIKDILHCHAIITNSQQNYDRPRKMPCKDFLNSLTYMNRQLNQSARHILLTR